MMHPTFKDKKVGDRLYYCGLVWVITAIGRKWVWAECLQGKHCRRFSKETAIAEKLGISTPKQCYATREEMEAAKS